MGEGCGAGCGAWAGGSTRASCRQASRRSKFIGESFLRGRSDSDSSFPLPASGATRDWETSGPFREGRRGPRACPARGPPHSTGQLTVSEFLRIVNTRRDAGRGVVRLRVISSDPGSLGWWPWPMLKVGCPCHFREITISGDRVEGARFHAAVLGSPSGSLAGRVVARIQPPDGLPGLAGRRADGGGPGAGAGRQGRGAGREAERTGPRTRRGRRRRGGQDRGRAGGRRFPGGRGRPASPREHAPVGDPGLGADRTVPPLPLGLLHGPGDPPVHGVPGQRGRADQPRRETRGRDPRQEIPGSLRRVQG